MAKLRLGNTTETSEVDEDLLTVIEYFSWHKTAHGYVASNISGKPLLLHRFIMGLKEQGAVVDHINGDKLDNRRANLRIVSYSQNSQNSKKAPSSAGFIGVAYDGGKKYIKAGIKIAGKRVHLGMFDNLIDAAIVYDKAAIAAFGKDARTNLAHFKNIVEKLSQWQNNPKPFSRKK